MSVRNRNSWDDCAALLAGRLAVQQTDLVENVCLFITEEMANDGLDIKPVFLLDKKLSGEAQALIEQSLRKIFQGMDPLDVAMDILTTIFLPSDDSPEE